MRPKVPQFQSLFHLFETGFLFHIKINLKISFVFKVIIVILRY